MQPVVADRTAKIKVRARIYGLRTFLDPGCPTDFYGAFRDNVRRFVRDCADVEGRATAGMPTWCTLLVDERSGAVVPLYTIEECVRRSPNPFCDYCRCTGWSHHLVSKRRYHFVIPADDDWDKPLQPDVYIHNHLLHALLHCNGFGHLLIINGRDGGSKFISGHNLMDLFDRLCTALRARAVSVEDVSRKGSMDLRLRLLLGVAHGTPWFARWGYQFFRGSFGVTREAYNRALGLLSSGLVEDLVADLADTGQSRELRRVSFAYRNLLLPDRVTPPLVTVHDLLRFLLELKRRPPQQKPPPPLPKTLAFPPPPTPPILVLPSASSSTRWTTKKVARRGCRDFAKVAAEMQSRWPLRRLRSSAQVIVDTLKQHGKKMTRQEVREAARLTIGDTGLLDFVLKSLGDCIVGGHVVRRVSNPVTRVLEFSLEELPSPAAAAKTATAEQDDDVAVVSRPEWPGAGQVERDLLTVYQSMVAGRAEAARVVLDAKHWVKQWGLQDEADDRLRFLVMWMPKSDELEELTRALPPSEVVMVEATASVGELRAEAERAMRDTYCVLEGFVAEVVEGVEGEDWDPVLVSGAESGAVVWVRGEGADMESSLRYEGGADTWSVKCACGARDDDGERMVACDACDVWHHTRCAGINDADAVPPLFFCGRCGRSVLGAGDIIE